MVNAAFEFHDEAWGNLLVISFEFAPRDEALDWARQLIESERFMNHKVIILTHSFLTNKAERIVSEKYKLTPRNWPQAVWENLFIRQRIFVWCCADIQELLLRLMVWKK